MTDQRDPSLPVELRTAADTEGETSRVLAKLEASGNARKMIRVMANSPTLFRPFAMLAVRLVTGQEFPADVRELVVLRLAVRVGSTYQWGEHLGIAAAAGVTPEQITAIETGAPVEAPLFDGPTRLALRFVDEALDHPPVSDATWREAVDTWELAGAMYLLYATTFWGTFIPSLITAVGAREPLEPVD